MSICFYDYAVGYGSREVIEDLRADVPETGICGLLGPSGVGKSTLLRSVLRLDDSVPGFYRAGELTIDGVSISSLEAGDIQRQIKILPQKARLYTGTIRENLFGVETPGSDEKTAARWKTCLDLLETIGLWEILNSRLDEPVLSLSIGQHKMLMLAKQLGDGAKYILVDEPLRDVSFAEEDQLKMLLRLISEDHGIWLVTHNKLLAKEICDTVLLVSGGRLIESAAANEFFNCPATELGREFLLSGSAWPRPVEEPIEEGSDSTNPVESIQEIKPAPRVLPPLEFHWIIPNSLGGMERPGLMRSISHDLQFLSDINCTTLVNLTWILHKKAGKPVIVR